MDSLTAYVNQRVLAITNDGKVILGTLRGFDQATNVILEQCQERIFSVEEGVVMIPLGLYLVRGDSLAVIGAIDPEKEDQQDWQSIRAQPLNPIANRAHN